MLAHCSRKLKVFFLSTISVSFFFFNICFHKTMAFKEIKTILSAFTFCKVYLKYVFAYQRVVTPQRIKLEDKGSKSYLNYPWCFHIL